MERDFLKLQLPPLEYFPEQTGSFQYKLLKFRKSVLYEISNSATWTGTQAITAQSHALDYPVALHLARHPLLLKTLIRSRPSLVHLQPSYFKQRNHCLLQSTIMNNSSGILTSNFYMTTVTSLRSKASTHSYNIRCYDLWFRENLALSDEDTSPESSPLILWK